MGSIARSKLKGANLRADHSRSPLQWLGVLVKRRVKTSAARDSAHGAFVTRQVCQDLKAECKTQIQ